MITKAELKVYLVELRQTLEEVSINNLEKIIFINIESFYYFMKDKQVDNIGKTVGEVVNIIEQYIPFCFEGEYFDYIIENIYLNSLGTNAREKGSKLEMIQNIYDEKDWNNFVNVCESIRFLKINQKI